MRTLALLVASGAAFGLMPLTSRWGAILGSVALVGMAVMLALAASGTASAIAVASGALGGFASGVAYEAAPALGGALLLALAYGERTIRVREARARVLHLALAAAGGALAGYLSQRYAGADLMLRGVVVVVAAVLGALPLLVVADDPIAFALDEVARDVPAPIDASLRAGAELRRTTDPSLLDKQSARDASEAWQSLVRLARARARLVRPQPGQPSPAVTRRLDQRIAEHVESLTRMYTAVDAANAANLSLDDSALKKVDSAGTSLDAVSQAIVEEVQ